MRRKKLTLARAEQAIADARGVVSVAARMTGVNRRTFYRFMNEHPRLRQAQVEAEEVVTDAALNVVVDAIMKDRDSSMARWWLEKRMSDRFGNRAEGVGAGAAPPNVVINLSFASSPERREIPAARSENGHV